LASLRKVTSPTPELNPLFWEVWNSPYKCFDPIRHNLKPR